MLQKNRVLPFGYKVENGVPVIDTIETLEVTAIYREYLHGASYKTIAARLTESRVHFLPTRCDWNKNRVKRMLENTKYLGDGFLPQIISEELFAEVQLKINSKTQNYSTTPKDFVSIRGKVVCEECGYKLRRYKTGNTFGFVCQNSNCKTSITYTKLLAECSAAIERINSAESLLMSQEQKTTAEEIEYLQKAFEDELLKENLDEEKAKELIFAQAVAKYRDADCGVNCRLVGQIKETLSADFENPITAIMTVSKQLMVDRDKNVSAVLLTGKKI